MNLTNQIHPNREQLEKLINGYPKDTPVVMINIIKFRDKTDKGDESGESAYERYGRNVLPFLKSVGGRLIWRGRISSTVIGTEEDQPDLVLLVEYPSVKKFLEMAMNPEYLKIANDRTISLKYGGLLAAQQEYKNLGK